MLNTLSQLVVLTKSIGVVSMKSCLQVCLCLLIASQCIAEDPITVILEEGRPHEYFGRLYVGSVEDGANRKLSFRLNNPSGSEIILHQPKRTCGCIEVLMSASKIEPGKSVDGVLSIKVEADRKPVWRQRVTFDPEKFGDGYVQLEVVCDIPGLLAFRDREVLVQVFGSSRGQSGDESGIIQSLVPFSSTPPIDADELELSIVPPHPGIKAEFARTPEGERAVRVSIDVFTIIGASPVTVQCRLKDKDSEKIAGVRLIIAERTPISVVPSTVRFSRGDDGRLSGEAIVARHFLSDESEGARDASPVVTAKLLDKSLEVTTKPMSRSVVRATVLIPENMEEWLVERNEIPRLVWDVMWGDDRVRPESKIYLGATSIAR
jgi:hypothetical protein